jgi:AcrR family transcriptional regulator
MEEKKYHHGDLKNALIMAGKDVLAQEGVNGLSLRKVAKQAGVSHSAPYAHFTDKQALIAAISTEGYKELYGRLSATIEAHANDIHLQLIEAAWTYVQFALADAETFKMMFSGVLEQEKNYPEFVEISQRTFQLVIDMVQNAQKAGLFRQETPQLLAVVVWGQVHGLISLTMMGQISHTLLERFNLREILIRTMNQHTLQPYVE